MTENLIRLTELPREVAALAGARLVSYRAAHRQVCDGLIPASKDARGHWQIDRAALPQIVASLRATTARAIAA